MGFPPENNRFWHKYGITLPHLQFPVKKTRSFADFFLILQFPIPIRSTNWYLWGCVLYGAIATGNRTSSYPMA